MRHRSYGWDDIATNSNARIKTAVILAAGTGTRLRPATLDAPKCLTSIGGQTILGRLVNTLRTHGIERLVVVTGHLGHRVREFLDWNAPDLRVDYVENTRYQTTNNIYSLWLAKRTVQEPFLLVESDLVFDPSMMSGMMWPNRIAVSRLLDWMNGTTVELSAQNRVRSFHATTQSLASPRYKTVNIYSLSLSLWRKTVEQLDRYVDRDELDGYYEVVFADLAAAGSLEFEAVFFNARRWYEVDTLVDLRNADSLFQSGSADAEPAALTASDPNERVRDEIHAT